MGASSTHFLFTPDGQRLLYGALQDSLLSRGLYSVPLDGHAPPVKLGSSVIESGSNGETALQLTPDGQKVLYMAHHGPTELFTVDVEGGVPVIVNGPLAPGRHVGGDSWSLPFQISTDGREVVYLADHDEQGFLELYAAQLP